jgi:hypothetical protein
MIRSMSLLTGVATLLLSSLSPVAAQFPDRGAEKARSDRKPTVFVRVERDEKGEPLALQTATVTYRDPQNPGVEVDLVGVVHIGEGHYYRGLNRQLREYDAVLYELVAPEGTVPRKPEPGQKRASNPVSMLQSFMKDALGVELQLEQVRYDRTNFVHADLGPAELREAMRKRGETPITLALGVALDMFRQMNKESARLQAEKQRRREARARGEELPPAEDQVDLMKLLFDPAGPSRLKRMMALQLARSDDGAIGPTLGALLIDDRNAAAMKVLHRELGRGHGRIAIFYGAAHMPDFERRLRDELDLEPVRTTWQEAWDLSLKETGPVWLFKLLRGLSQQK